MSSRDNQDRIRSAEGIGDARLSSRVVHPLAIDDESVFVVTRWQSDLFDPASIAQRNHGRGRWAPIIEGTRHKNFSGRGVYKLKTNQPGCHGRVGGSQGHPFSHKDFCFQPVGIRLTPRTC